MFSTSSLIDPTGKLLLVIMLGARDEISLLIGISKIKVCYLFNFELILLVICN